MVLLLVRMILRAGHVWSTFKMLREMEFIYGNENFLFGGNCSENSGEDGEIR